MDLKEKVTVCIPTYNRADTIANAVTSVLNQTYDNLEILIVDNASSDNTENVIEQFQDPRIQYIYCKEKLDVNYNFMRAAGYAKTDIICIFHSDDYYYPWIVEEELNYIRSSGTGAVFSKMEPIKAGQNMREVPQERKRRGQKTVYHFDEFFEKTLKDGIPVSCPTLMTRKSILKQVGLLDKRDGLISDLSLWLPVVKKYCIIELHEKMMNYGISEDQLSFQIHNRRCMRSPQFLILDDELKRSCTNISKRLIRKYRMRSMKDYYFISKNSLKDRKYKTAVKLACGLAGDIMKYVIAK